MSFLAPLFLLLGLLAIPIILLYMLRLRRQPLLVSSTLLWQKLLRDRQANAPWQRLRRNLLLLLQLLILAALVVALARPYFAVPSIVSGNVVVLLDGSASMQATDVEPTRFAAAKREVARWIDDLGGNDRMTVILAGRTPQVLAAATNDGAILHNALEAATPDSAPADWPAALSLANGAVQGFREARIVVVSDGGLPQDLPPLATEAVFVPVGQRPENLAIAALATRKQIDDTNQLLASVTNHGAQVQEALVNLDRNGALFDSRRVTVRPGETRHLIWELQDEVASISAYLTEQTEDYLPLDDRAWAVHEGAVRNRALLVTPGNIFLEQILRLLPGLELYQAAPGEPLPEEAFDLYVFDSVPLPASLPDAALLVVNPLPADGEVGAGEALLQVGGTFSNTTVTRLADSPLLQFVEWRDVQIRQASNVAAPGAQPLISAEGGPLLVAGERQGQRFAILTFDLHDSDLPLKIAFPVLMANLTGWLSPGRAFEAGTALQPGETVAITPGGESTAVLVQLPDGSLWSEPTTEAGVTVFDGTEQLGLYQVTLRTTGGDRPAGSFAVNLFSPEESAIVPAESLQFGRTALQTPDTGAVAQREVWAWLALLAFLVLMVEWWIHFRGTQLPRLSWMRPR